MQKMSHVTLSVFLAIFVSGCSSSVVEDIELDYGGVRTTEQARQRLEEHFSLIETADVRITYNSDDKITFNKPRFDEVNGRYRLKDLKSYFAGQSRKEFIVVTIGKHSWSIEETSERVALMRDYFIDIGYSRILIDQAGSGLSRGVYLDYTVDKKSA